MTLNYGIMHFYQDIQFGEVELSIHLTLKS